MYPLQLIDTVSLPTAEKSLDSPRYVFHESFTLPEADQQFDPELQENQEYSRGHMPDEVTREYACFMHYAAYRLAHSVTSKSRSDWNRKYLFWRDQIILGNRKLVYKVVRKWVRDHKNEEDTASDCQIVFIQAVAAYNPWIGVRFSTYTFTCLTRALSRMTHRQFRDRFNSSVSIETMTGFEPSEEVKHEMPGTCFSRVEEYLEEGHDLLSMREKLVIKRRFLLAETEKKETLEQVGQQIGLTKERVRQLQISALRKLRDVLQSV